jgi:hypothetical protein
MAADNWKVYDKFKEYVGDGTIDLDNDTFKCALFLSTSNAATLSVGTGILGDLTNQHANGNGYTTGGVALTGVTWVEAAGTVTFDCDNISWTASGGSIVARFAVIYSDTAASDQLVCMNLMDNAPADITATDGQLLRIEIHASGVFTLSGGDT